MFKSFLSKLASEIEDYKSETNDNDETIGILGIDSLLGHHIAQIILKAKKSAEFSWFKDQVNIVGFSLASNLSDERSPYLKEIKLKKLSISPLKEILAPITRLIVVPSVWSQKIDSDIFDSLSDAIGSSTKCKQVLLLTSSLSSLPVNGMCKKLKSLEQDLSKLATTNLVQIVRIHGLVISDLTPFLRRKPYPMSEDETKLFVPFSKDQRLSLICCEDVADFVLRVFFQSKDCVFGLQSEEISGFSYNCYKCLREYLKGNVTLVETRMSHYEKEMSAKDQNFIIVCKLIAEESPIVAPKDNFAGVEKFMKVTNRRPILFEEWLTHKLN
ncbi:hypothetical protein Ciccas_005630 [Cichlidogyrus casuarinus]|uniref:Proteasome assembly chaperone 1 n=1 Tax=Cichlidogyrus casuarinus TaxID=1844966 RepID=A0ABD2Q857_9PLAT